MSERPPAILTVLKLAGCCLLASVVAAALMFPFAGGLGLVSNRASEVVANGSAQLLQGEVPAVSTMVDRRATSSRGCTRSAGSRCPATRSPTR